MEWQEEIFRWESQKKTTTPSMLTNYKVTQKLKNLYMYHSFNGSVTEPNWEYKPQDHHT